MDTADFHFEQPGALALSALAGVALFVGLCWAERRRRRGLRVRLVTVGIH
jgi:hypothetical protein